MSEGKATVVDDVVLLEVPATSLAQVVDAPVLLSNSWALSSELSPEMLAE